MTVCVSQGDLWLCLGRMQCIETLCKAYSAHFDKGDQPVIWQNIKNLQAVIARPAVWLIDTAFSLSLCPIMHHEGLCCTDTFTSLPLVACPAGGQTC